MTDPSEPGYRLKLRRAKEHLDFITREGDRFIEQNLDAPVLFDPQPENQWTILYRDHVEPMSPMWGTYLGDVVHNIRGALDQLICALILRANPDDSVEHAQFPIYDSSTKWVQDIEARTDDRRPMIDGVPAPAVAMLKELQPYKRTGAARLNAPLMLLLIASNADKHRDLHVALPRISAHDRDRGYIKIEPKGFIKILSWKIAPAGTPVETGAEVGRMKVRTVVVPPPSIEVGVHIVVPMEVAFRLPSKERITTHRNLWEMLNEAWNIVLNLEDISGIHGLPSPGPGWVTPGVAAEAPPPRRTGA